MTRRIIGTPPFMSPEQPRSPRDVGPRSDVFSLGTLLVHAATGSGPFGADSPYLMAYQVVQEEPSLGAVPEALRAVVEPCLAKEPGERPSSDELLVLLRNLPVDLGGTEADGSARVGPVTWPRSISPRRPPRRVPARKAPSAAAACATDGVPPSRSPSRWPPSAGPSPC